MLRSCLLSLLLFVCVNPLYSMAPGSLNPQQNSILEATFRDVFSGGLLTPALLADGMVLLLTKEQKGSVEMINQVSVGCGALAVAAVMQLFGHIFDVRKGNPTHTASIACDGFKFFYVVLIFYAAQF